LESGCVPPKSDKEEEGAGAQGRVVFKILHPIKYNKRIAVSCNYI